MNSQSPREAHSSFWPVTILGICFAVLVAQQVTFAVRQYIDGVRIRDQQATALRQASDAEQKLTAMMMDLLLLAKTDPDAKTIVDTYRIQYNAPVGLPAQNAAGAPGAAPAAGTAPATGTMAPAVVPTAPASAVTPPAAAPAAAPAVKEGAKRPAKAAKP
jgi:hypothetical protein